jgi:hypothetical protein
MAQARRNTFNFCLAFTAVFIAVTMVATAHTVYRFTPILFLSIAEFTVGQRDVVVEAGSWTGIRHLNFSKILSTVGKESDFRYSSPRLVQEIDVFNLASCDKTDDGLVIDTSSLSQLYFGPRGSDCFDSSSSSSSPCIRLFASAPVSFTPLGWNHSTMILSQIPQSPTATIQTLHGKVSTLNPEHTTAGGTVASPCPGPCTHWTLLARRLWALDVSGRSRHRVPERCSSSVNSR